MKRIIIIAFLSVLAHNVYAQLQSSIGVFAGAGASTKYNYDVGLAGGLSYTKQVGGRTCLGAIAFYQGYNYRYRRLDRNNVALPYGEANYLCRCEFNYVPPTV